MEKDNNTAQPFVLTLLAQESKTTSNWETLEHAEFRCGDQCPVCGKADLDYDGLLNLICLNCGYAVGGCFT
jgi:hypothetical protein